MKNQFPIVGMHCASCAKLIERKIIKIPNVVSANVNYGSETAYVESNKNVEKDIYQAVTSLGYKIGINVEEEKKKELKILKTKVFISLTIFLFFMSLMLFEINISRILILILASFMQFVVGYEFYKSFWSELKNFSFGMNSLVAIGTTAAYFTGYYETSFAIIALILLGKYIETNAKNKSTKEIKKLLELKEGLDSKLIIGDIVHVKPGQKIATDGIIIEGESYIDESMVTGESTPVKKKIEDYVVGGTINKNGSFVFKVTKIGSETVVARIIETVRLAQGSKAEIQRLVDILSSYFIPVVFILAVITYLIFGLPNAIAVLVIACPCAMGLATPTAIVVSVGRAAKLGILIKDINSLEILNRIKKIIFDKTGTLTIGKPVLVNKVLKKYLQIAASLEKHSSHPLAEAIKYPKLLKVTSFKNIEGVGIEGIVNGKKYFLGKTKKYSIALVLKDKTLEYFEVKDKLKNNVNSTITEFNNKNIETWMITGDRKKVAEKIAKEAGIKNIISEVMPEDKANKVKSLSLSNKVTNNQLTKVAFVGDGINDAPALASADVGIAMGTGSDVAIETSGITLLNKDFRSVLRIYNLSHATVTVIKQNLFWAFGYNVVLIPVAMIGNLNPMLAAAAMSLSSISVVLNSLRLNKVKI